MKRLTQLAQAVAALGAMSLAGSALADTIQIDDFVYGSALHTTLTTHIKKTDVPTADLTTEAGEVKGLLNGNSFQTFCADIFQSFPGWSVPNSSYSLVLGSTAFGASKATDVNRLFTNWYSTATNEGNSTAFQVALWEIIYESTSTYDVGSGTFTATGGNAPGAVFATANTMLGSLGSLGSNYLQVDVYQSASKQDFTTVTTVPEPEAYALALVGLGVLVGARKLKARGSKAAQASA